MAFFWLHLSLFVLYASAAILAIPSVTIQTPFGPIIGTVDSTTGVSMFLGVPYAQPPLGSLRFAPPVPYPSQSDPINATAFGSPCVQFAFGSNPPVMEPDSNEDCLFLNVFVPPTSSSAGPLPIFVFIHGGAFVFGSARDYPAANLALSTNSIVVTIQYRLNLFGFLTIPELSVYNMGLLDQQLALKWIHAAAKSFGGSPAQVVIAGQSAGAASVVAHLLCPASWPLFTAAVVESPGPLYLSPAGLSSSRWESLLDLSSCPANVSTLACLRQFSAAQLLSQSQRYSISMVVDGPSGFLHDDPLSLFYRGAFRPNTTIIIGDVLSEGLLLAYQLNNFQTTVSQSLFWQAAAYLMLLFPTIPLRNWTSGDPPAWALSVASNLAVRAAALYGLTPSTNLTTTGWFNATAQILGDLTILCPATQIATYAAKNAPGRVFRYIWTHPVDWMFPFNVTHACELGYVFHSEEVLGTRFHTQADLDLSSAVGAAWISIAQHAAPVLPSSSPVPKWPAFDPSVPSVLQLDWPLSVVSLGNISLPQICLNGWNPLMLGSL